MITIPFANKAVELVGQPVVLPGAGASILTTEVRFGFKGLDTISIFLDYDAPTGTSFPRFTYIFPEEVPLGSFVDFEYFSPATSTNGILGPIGRVITDFGPATTVFGAGNITVVVPLKVPPGANGFRIRMQEQGNLPSPSTINEVFIIGGSHF